MGTTNGGSGSPSFASFGSSSHTRPLACDCICNNCEGRLRRATLGVPPLSVPKCRLCVRLCLLCHAHLQSAVVLSPSRPHSISAARQDQGGKPFFVGATAGTTVLGAYDPFDSIGPICRRHGVWHHVDACWGGGALLSEKHRRRQTAGTCFAFRFMVELV